MGNQPLHETTDLVASGLRLSGWRNPMQRFFVVVAMVVAMGSGWKIRRKDADVEHVFCKHVPFGKLT